MGITMKLIRSMECGLPGEVSKCLLSYPLLRDFVANPYDYSGNLTVRLRGLRQHAAELARDHALDELAAASVDERADGATDDDHRARRTRQRGARLLHRLAPGRSPGIGAVVDSRGEVQTNAADMACTLRAHWRGGLQLQGP